MDKTNDSAMVALLPTTDWWCNIEIPHTTLVYVGKISSLPEGLHEELIKVSANLALLSPIINLKVSGIQTYGDDEPVHVLTLIKSPEIVAMRSFLDDWDNGEFPDFSPHATIGPVGSLQQDPPIMLSFNRILVSWGEDNQTFRLRNY